MEEQRKVEARPPVLIDGLVRILIPPAARESVIGDLWERYRSPGRYLADALRVLPFVLASRVRRTSNIAALALIGFMLFGCLGGFVMNAPVNEVPRWARAAIPALAALFGLVLRDAYRADEGHSIRSVLLDLVVISGFALAAEAVLFALHLFANASADWVLTPQRGVFGFVALPCVFLVRFGLGADPDPRLKAAKGSIEAGDLARAYAVFRKRARWRNGLEIFAGLVLVAISANVLPTVQDVTVFAIGVIWNAGHLLYLGYIATQGAIARLPESLGFAEVQMHYARELGRQRSLRRYIWWWYLVPMFAGIVVRTIMPGIVGTELVTILAGMSAVILLALLLDQLTRDRLRIFDSNLTLLREMRERIA